MAGELDQVGFTHKGRTYDAATPCLFHQHCTPTDWDRWAKHTGDWLNAVRGRATTPERMQKWEQIAGRYAGLIERNSDCSALHGVCTSATRALVSMAQLLHALAESWGEPVQESEVLTDWGWIDALQLPMIPGLDEIKDRVRAAVWRRYLPLAILAGLVFLDSRKVRR